MSNVTQLHMSPRDIQNEVAALRELIGPRADIYCQIMRGAEPVMLSAYANGICGDLTFSVTDDDWAPVFTKAREKWAEVRERYETEALEKMALAIIAITHRKGECSDADIRAAKFSDADVKHYGARACERANEMAANGPFSITIGAKANAA